MSEYLECNENAVFHKNIYIVSTCRIRYLCQNGLISHWYVYTFCFFSITNEKDEEKKKCGQFLALYKVCETKYLKVCDKCNLI